MHACTFLLTWLFLSLSFQKNGNTGIRVASCLNLPPGRPTAAQYRCLTKGAVALHFENVKVLLNLQQIFATGY